MLDHHAESLEILKQYFWNKPEVIAVVFGGSVAKGGERPDSDLDAMVVLTKEAYEQRMHEHTTVETIQGMCTYEKGYFDIKYLTKDYLSDAAQKGSEPTRNAFVKSQVLFSRDPEIVEIVSKIPVFQMQEYEEKMLSFYSNFCLNYYYFWKECRPTGFMKIHVINEMVYSIYRMILQENQVLFPSNRRLEETVGLLEDAPKEIQKLASAFMEDQTEETCEAFVEAFRAWSHYQEQADFNKILTRYTSDFEQWWRVPRPLIAEW